MVETRRVFEKYDLIYRHDPAHGRTWLHSYILHEGYHLFEVTATDAKQHPPCGYYVIAQNKKEAREIFKATYTWIGIIKSVEQCNADTERRVCVEFHKKVTAII